MQTQCELLLLSLRHRMKRRESGSKSLAIYRQFAGRGTISRIKNLLFYVMKLYYLKKYHGFKNYFNSVALFLIVSYMHG